MHCSTINCAMSCRGKCRSKTMELPCDMHPESFVTLSADGHRCAALTASNDLVVWTSHMTEGSIIQEHLSINKAIQSHEPMPANLKPLLRQHGSSLLNHPYEHGMTLVASCVNSRNVQFLKDLLCWAHRNSCKLTLESTICIPDLQITVNNIVELALFVQSPEITKVQHMPCLDFSSFSYA